MINLIIAAHGKLADGLKSNIELLMGKTHKLYSCCLFIEDDSDTFGEKIFSLIEENDDGDGTIIFVDIFGGTPCNQSINLLRRNHSKNNKLFCISGVNSSMLLQAVISRENYSVQELYEICYQSGHEGIVKVNELLEKRKEE